jgi:hypothetical protein
LKAIYKRKFDHAVINSNLTTNEVVGSDFQDLLSNVMVPLSPGDLTAVTFTRGGQGVEKAILTAMAERGSGKWTVLGFDGAIHGNHSSFALSKFRGQPKLPTLNWPVLSYPRSQDESQVLEQAQSALRQ